MKKITIYSLILVLIDQIVKYLITLNLNEFESIIIIKNILSLTYVKNNGAAFSILSGNTIFLIIISIITLIIIYKYLIINKKHNKIEIITYSLFVGGLLGNLIDRIIHNYVIDYINLFIINFPVFNLADTFIVISVIILIALEIKEELWKLKSKKNKVE